MDMKFKGGCFTVHYCQYIMSFALDGKQNQIVQPRAAYWLNHFGSSISDIKPTTILHLVC